MNQKHYKRLTLWPHIILLINFYNNGWNYVEVNILILLLPPVKMSIMGPQASLD